MDKKRAACIFDLDGTLDHVECPAHPRIIRGRTTDAYISARALDILAEISMGIDIFIATGRSEATIGEFRRNFNGAGIRVAGWILEHGAVLPDRPEWTKTVWEGIDFNETWDALERLISDLGLTIDAVRYRPDRKGSILLSGKGALLAEYLIDAAAPILKGRFRTLAGKRKITLLPKKGEKWMAFAENYSATHRIAFAAGDDPDDLRLLCNADFPLTLAGASWLVQKLVKQRGGYLSSLPGHAGTEAMLGEILARLNGKEKRSAPLPGLRYPVEEAEDFRPSRREYLDLLFANAPPPNALDDPRWLRQMVEKLGQRLVQGRKMIIEVRMRDWGGEIKSLMPLLEILVPILPEARWRLLFRPERLGGENLKCFGAIGDKLFSFIGAKGHSGLSGFEGLEGQFSAPGVPGSPDDPGEASCSLWLYDHGDDMGHWYDRAIPRRIFRHPERAHTWFVNPMYLKISGALLWGKIPRESKILAQLSGRRVMMAANLIGKTDIRIATQGFAGLAGELDSLIIAPRVVTNPERNRWIEEAVEEIGMEIVRLSQLREKERPRVILVDTCGDLPHLYSHCCITYLGGGFDPGKRGFDPMESLCQGVPVICGPIFDYNRIAVQGLAETGWIRILQDEADALASFQEAARAIFRKRPCPERLRHFLDQRREDPLCIAAEILADLAGESEFGYFLPEHRTAPQERIDPKTLEEPQGEQ